MKLIDAEELIKQINESNLKNKKAIIEIIENQHARLELNINPDSRKSCLECVYFPDKSPCQYCEYFSNFEQVPF